MYGQVVRSGGGTHRAPGPGRSRLCCPCSAGTRPRPLWAVLFAQGELEGKPGPCRMLSQRDCAETNDFHSESRGSQRSTMSDPSRAEGLAEGRQHSRRALAGGRMVLARSGSAPSASCLPGRNPAWDPCPAGPGARFPTSCSSPLLCLQARGEAFPARAHTPVSASPVPVRVCPAWKLHLRGTRAGSPRHLPPFPSQAGRPGRAEVLGGSPLPPESL